MPIYEYQCSMCKQIKEELNSLGTDLHSTGCLGCFNPMRRIMSAPQGVVTGSTNQPPSRQSLRVEENQEQDFSACEPVQLDSNGNQTH